MIWFFRSLLLGLALSSALSAKPTAPDWLQAAAALPSGDCPPDLGAVVLLDECYLTVSADGTFNYLYRKALKLVNENGRKQAIAKFDYDASAIKVRDFNAWMIRPQGTVIAYGKKDRIDLASFSTGLELYGQNRTTHIRAVDDYAAGAIFGYEYSSEDKSIYNQEFWGFQSKLPVVSSRFALTLPAGWSQRAFSFNGANAVPVVSGATLVWAHRQLAPLKDEPLSTSREEEGLALGIDIIPPAKSPAANKRRHLDSWAQITAYFAPLYVDAAKVDASLQAKATSLTAGATDEWDRIQRLAAYAQGLNYISLTLNAGAGDGAVPRPASRVLACGYGDCKEKATLLRALLNAVGVASHPLIIYYGDRDYLNRDWPSAFQFNHCILAIKVPASVQTPATLEHPGLGHLLIFDPTDPHTPLGWLPATHYGTTTLLLDAQHGGLLTLPAPSNEETRHHRAITAALTPQGNISGTILHSYDGSRSSEARQTQRSQSAADYRRQVETTLNRSIPAVSITRLETQDDFPRAHFEQAIDFRALQYAKPMRDVLLVVKPFLTGPAGNPGLEEKTRRNSLRFDAGAYTERTELTLPVGYAIDELPAPVEIKASFATYSAKITPAGEKLLCERTYTKNAVTLPASEYEAVKRFYERMAKSDRATVVLKKIAVPAGSAATP